MTAIHRSNVGRELTLTALRYAIPIVLDGLGWSGDVEIDGSIILRGPGFAARGHIECESQVGDVVAVVLHMPTEKDGAHEVEIQLRCMPGTPLRGLVRIAIGVAPEPKAGPARKVSRHGASEG